MSGQSIIRVGRGISDKFVQLGKRIYNEIEQRVFDRYMGGVSTIGVVRTSVDTFAIGSENWPYNGCVWPALSSVLKDVLRGYGKNRTQHSTFVDLGSGKGKALLIAGRFPFSRVVGVEIDSGLAEAARRNIDRAGKRLRADSVESVTASAVSWQVPDDTSVVFMYNPFFGQTFYDAMANVFDSYDRNPRDMHIVYTFPWEHEWLLSTGRVLVERVRPEAWLESPGWWKSEHVIVVYHVTGRDQQSGSCQTRSRPISTAERQALKRWRLATYHDFSSAL
jgi:SAM-dependent methyltransferase